MKRRKKMKKKKKEDESACSKHAVVLHQAEIITSPSEKELVTSSAKY